jgi:hypothetical protein
VFDLLELVADDAVAVHVKEGARTDVGIWSRRRDDGPLP